MQRKLHKEVQEKKMAEVSSSIQEYRHKLERLSGKVKSLTEEVKSLRQLEASLKEENAELKRSKRKITELYQKAKGGESEPTEEIRRHKTVFAKDRAPLFPPRRNESEAPRASPFRFNLVGQRKPEERERSGNVTPVSPIRGRPVSEEEERSKVAILKSPPRNENIFARYQKTKASSPRPAENSYIEFSSEKSAQRSFPMRPVTPLSSSWAKSTKKPSANDKKGKKSSNFANLLGSI